MLPVQAGQHVQHTRTDRRTEMETAKTEVVLYVLILVAHKLCSSLLYKLSVKESHIKTGSGGFQFKVIEYI